MDITEKAKDFLNRRSNQKINESTPVDEVELEEATDTIDINTHTPAAAQRLAKKLANKWSELRSLTPKGKSVTVPNERFYIRYIEKQPEFEGIAESVELEEATEIWSKEGITLTRFSGGKDLGVLFQLSQERSIGNKKLSSSYIVLTRDQVKGLFGTKIQNRDYM